MSKKENRITNQVFPGNGLVYSEVTPGVYKLIDEKSEAFYTGSTGNMYKRLMAHAGKLLDGKHENTNLQKAYNESGSLKLSIVEIITDKELRLAKEQEILDQNKGNPKFLNIAEDAVSPWKGKEMHPHTKEVLRQANTGRVKSPEELAKLSASKTGVKRPGEFCVKMREIALNRPPQTAQCQEKKRLAMLGRKHTSESLETMRENSPNRISIEIDGVTYRSFSEAAEKLGMDASVVCRRSVNPNYPNFKRLSSEK